MSRRQAGRLIGCIVEAYETTVRDRWAPHEAAYALRVAKRVVDCIPECQR